MERRLRAVKAVALAIAAVALLGALIEMSRWRRAPDHDSLRRLQADVVTAFRDGGARTIHLRDHAPDAAMHVCIFGEYADIQGRLQSLLPDVAPPAARLPPTRENETALVFVAAGRADPVFLDIPTSAFIEIERSCGPVAMARLDIAPLSPGAGGARLRFRAAAAPSDPDGGQATPAPPRH
jgi:hypothetical protein